MNTDIEIKIDQSCTNCNLCYEICPEDVFETGKESPVPSKPEECFLCGHCIAVCPKDSLVISDMDSENFKDISEEWNLDPDILTGFFRTRRSIRHYKDKRIPKKKLKKLIEAARYAPTAKNLQNFEITVITSREKRRELVGLVLEFFKSLVEKYKNPFFRFLFRIKEGKEKTRQVSELIPTFEEAYQKYQNGEDPLFYKAPAVVVLHAPEDKDTSKDNCIYPLYHMILTGRAMGIGSCINGYFTAAASRNEKIGKSLNVPEENKIYACATFGYSKYTFLKTVDRKEPDVEWFD